MASERRDDVDLPERFELTDDGQVVQEQLASVLPRIGELLANAVDADACGLYIYDETYTRTLAAIRYGYEAIGFDEGAISSYSNRIDSPIEFELIRTLRPIQRRSQDDYRRMPVAGGLELSGNGCCDLTVPVIENGLLLGIAQFWRCFNAIPFTDEEIETVMDLAQVGAMALAWARGYALERHERQQVDTLLDVASMMSTAETIDEALPKFTQAIRTATGVDVCQLFIHDEAGRGVLAACSDGMTRRESEAVGWSDSYVVEDVPVDQRLRVSLQTEVVRDFRNAFTPDSRFQAYVENAGISSLIVTPVVFHGRMIGSIYSWYRDPVLEPGVREIAIIQSIASQAGGVIARSRMYTRYRQHLRESESLLRIGDAVLTSETLEGVLDVIAEELSELVPYDYSYIAMSVDSQETAFVLREWGPYDAQLTNRHVPLDSSLLGQAIRSRAAINLADVSIEPSAFRFDESLEPIRGASIVPLSTERGVIGAWYIGRLAVGTLSQDEQRIASLIAQQAAFAIERLRSRDELVRRSRRQAFLANVLDKLVLDQDPEPMLAEVATLAADGIADGVLIGLSSWQYGALDWVAQASDDPALRQVLRQVVDDYEQTPDRGVVEDLLCSDNACLCSLDDIDARIVRLVPQLRGTTVHNALIVPMRRYYRATGLIVLFSTHPLTPLDRDFMQIMNVIGGRIADTIERRQTRLDQEALLRVSEAMNSQTDLRSLLTLFVDEFNEIVPFDKFLVGEVVEGGAGIRSHVYHNIFRAESHDIYLPADTGISGEVLRSGVPVLDNRAHVRPSTYYVTNELATHSATNGESAMVAPLDAGEGAFGVLFCGRSGIDRFNEAEFETFLFFAGLASAAFRRTELVQNNRMIYRSSVEALAAVVDAKDPTTHAHSRNVAHYSRACAEVFDFSPEEIEAIELAGLMHDIGKISIPDSVLQKPGRLTDEEFDLIKTHPVRGARILERHPALEKLVPIVRHHHERYDGNGYPDGIDARQIPIGASIIAVADAFDTMISDRTYQQRRSVAAALAELERCAGTQFHPEVVQRLVHAIRFENRLLSDQMDHVETLT